MVTAVPIKQQSTPMMRQFLSIKEHHQDAILFFRLGDFYEMFFEDAATAAKELELTLTGRGKDEHRVPMCGVPHHAADTYIHRLVKKGYKVAICEQVEEASESKGITRREVVKVITPGTVMSQESIKPDENNYLLACCGTQTKGYGISFVDCSTGEFRACLAQSSQEVEEYISKIDPKECLFDEDCDIKEDEQRCINRHPIISIDRAEKECCDFFKIHHVSSFGLTGYEPAFPAMWMILNYLKQTQKSALAHITRCLPHELNDTLALDTTTIRNLELIHPLYSQDNQGSVYWVLNKTKTSMGARRLKHWLKNPLKHLSQIHDRLDAVEQLKKDILSREEIREQLHLVYDLERLISRIASGLNQPRDLIALKESLKALNDLEGILSQIEGAHLIETIQSFIEKAQTPDHDFSKVIQLIESSIIDPAPATITNGHIIKPGFNNELDELTDSFKSIKEWIATLEEIERKKTGIKTLKVGFNKVFGYFFQVSKGQQDQVPSHYIRKQTLSNQERYITPELKEKETILLHGEEKQQSLEQQLYKEIVESIKEAIPMIQECADHLATLDCLQSFASVAQQFDYCRPEFTEESHVLMLEKAKHPVLQKQQPQQVISNSIYSNQDQYVFLITGPNMAGKSTVMKQIACIVIMAQCGCFVPAQKATLSIVDRCFTRIGASDNLSQGQSTFMVEMAETATILHNATSQSLILLDEIGRGTSTYDGLSIAGAVLAYIHDAINARTLFATHYHELTQYVTQYKQCKNMSMAIDEVDGQLAFTYTLIEGAADKSYGVHVAKMAGLPDTVIQQAETMLDNFEKKAVSPNQLSLF